MGFDIIVVEFLLLRFFSVFFSLVVEKYGFSEERDLSKERVTFMRERESE